MKKDDMPILENNKYYIILSPTEDDAFTMAAYDTTGTFTKEIDKLPLVAIVHEGIVSTIDSDVGGLYKEGLLSLEKKKIISRDKSDNVVYLNFGDNSEL